MPEHADLKSKSYLVQMIHFAETLLGIQLKGSGQDRFTGFCPFHSDTRDSFRVYVDGKEEVRFHCFGACSGDWDIYDLIMLRHKCRFKQAQQMWADYLGVRDFTPHSGKGSGVPETETEPEDTIAFSSAPALGRDIVEALRDASRFYNDLLLTGDERFDPIRNYLTRRGVGRDIIRRFVIGYAPPYSDETHAGRALISRFIDRFEQDFVTFRTFSAAGLVRLLNDGSAKGYGYYRQQIDFSRKNIFTQSYGDYFAGRIVFPIFDANGSPVGLVGRRPDNRGKAHWIKQRTADTAIRTKGWLYGIDKAARYIRHYRTIILVEGIFDYFAFFNLLQDQDKPVVVSTLGSHLTAEAAGVLKDLGVEHYIVAYDCDPAGKKGIVEVATRVGGQVHYLGGLADGQDPFDKLKSAVNAISGFSLNHLLTGAKKAQAKTDKPVSVSIITSGPVGERNLIFSPAEVAEMTRAGLDSVPDLSQSAQPKDRTYRADDFLPLITYDHANKSLLDQKIEQIIRMLEAPPAAPVSGGGFSLPDFFMRAQNHTSLGPAIILWLRLVIEQQSRKRRVKATDSTLAQWLNTTRATISTYKHRLIDLGYLTIQTKDNAQRLSVRFHPRTPY
jgi:DNA primase catalytic core